MYNYIFHLIVVLYTYVPTTIVKRVVFKYIEMCLQYGGG